MLVLLLRKPHNTSFDSKIKVAHSFVFYSLAAFYQHAATPLLFHVSQNCARQMILLILFTQRQLYCLPRPSLIIFSSDSNQLVKPFLPWSLCWMIHTITLVQVPSIFYSFFSVFPSALDILKEDGMSLVWSLQLLLIIPAFSPCSGSEDSVCAG